MTTCPADDDLRQLLVEEPPPTAQLSAHVGTCPDCQSRLNLIKTGHTVAFPRGEIPFVPTVVNPFRDLPSQPAPEVSGYEILGLLGRGGMGVVYKARQTQLNRLVALKVIAAGSHAPVELVDRFRVEAMAVARFQHPNIVQIHEVGEASGVLFLALEYVEGGSLDRRLDGTPQPPRDAAGLVETLSRAMQAAHDKGVVHRDLKPANVLLSFSRDAERSGGAGALRSASRLNECVPKITDFGLAKQMESTSGLTHTGEVLGTPSYMAPEQAEGDLARIGPVTDVYALGAILYEMVTGRPPFKGANLLDTLELVRHEPPVPPRRLVPKLPRDLETICLKCLEKPTARRYPRAADLADDLRRFLDGRPIVARPTPWWEHALKWAGRRPTAATLVAVSVAAALALFAGGVWHTRQVNAERIRAESNFDLAMRAVEDMLKEVGEEKLAADMALEYKRKALLKHAKKFLTRFLEEGGRDTPQEQRRAGLALQYLGDIERFLGNFGPAIEAYRESISLLDGAALAHSWNYLGEAHRLAGKSAPAGEAYARAQSLWEQLAERSPDETEYSRELAQTLYNRGILAENAGQFPEAEAYLGRSVVLMRTLVEEEPGEKAHRQHLARAYLNLATARRGANRLPDAEESCQRAIGLLRVLAKDEPNHSEYRHELGVVLNNLGNVRMGRSRPTDALAHHEEAVALFERLTRDHPGVPTYRQELANSLNGLANVRSHTGQLPAAGQLWARAADLSADLSAQYPAVASYRGDLGLALGNLGYALAVGGDLQAARPKLEESLRHLRAALKSAPDHADFHAALRNRRQTLAEVLIQLGDHTRAAEIASELGQGTGKADPPAEAVYFAACFLARAAKLARDASRHELAKAHGNRAIVLLREACRRGYRVVGEPKPKPEELFVPPLASLEECQRLMKQLRGK